MVKWMWKEDKRSLEEKSAIEHPFPFGRISLSVYFSPSSKPCQGRLPGPFFTNRFTVHQMTMSPCPRMRLPKSFKSSTLALLSAWFLKKVKAKGHVWPHCCAELWHIVTHGTILVCKRFNHVQPGFSAARRRLAGWKLVRFVFVRKYDALP